VHVSCNIVLKPYLKITKEFFIMNYTHREYMFLSVLSFFLFLIYKLDATHTES